MNMYRKYAAQYLHKMVNITVICRTMFANFQTPLVIMPLTTPTILSPLFFNCSLHRSSFITAHICVASCMINYIKSTNSEVGNHRSTQ